MCCFKCTKNTIYKKMVDPRRIELLTSRLSGAHSNHLSYGS